jgi:hypothetical protein
VTVPVSHSKSVATIPLAGNHATVRKKDLKIFHRTDRCSAAFASPRWDNLEQEQEVAQLADLREWVDC